jgi:adenosylcobinamide-phosphate synthase
MFEIVIPGIFILLLALFIDLVLGEPPNPVHPVVWIGNFVNLLMKAPVYQNRSRAFQFIYGVCVVLLTVGLFTTATYFLLWWLKEISILAYIIVGAVLFKCMFSLRGLRQAALRVKRLLVQHKLPEARSAVRALVGRDTTQLDEGQVVSAAVESVGENCCDSFVAPLLFFVFLGVPGAVAYRAINTLDNSIGFRGKFEYLGKFAARLDDVVNFIPARLNGLLFVTAAWISCNDARGAWRIMFRDHRKTASPNGGWTMGAMAGALEVQLEKLNYYKLGDPQKKLLPGTIKASVTIMMLTAAVWTLVLIIGQVGYHVLTQT